MRSGVFFLSSSKNWDRVFGIEEGEDGSADDGDEIFGERESGGGNGCASPFDEPKKVWLTKHMSEGG